MKIRVLVADDHKLFRQGLISLMRTRENLIEVVGEATTGLEALQMVEQFRPDIVLMDLYMPLMDGLEATRIIRERFPETAVVILTSSESNEHLYEAVSIGASGFLLKSLDASELFHLLDGVKRGEAVMTRAMAARLMKGVASRLTQSENEADLLTEREIDVLKLVAKGFSNPQISKELSVTVNTVKSHIKSILDKLNVENRTQAATYALQHGLVERETGNCE
jgi:DNA-binding NarL/FixJ family response regulator